MYESLNKELLARLDIIGDKIGKGAGYIFPLAVRQVYVDTIVLTVALILSSLGAAICARYVDGVDLDRGRGFVLLTVFISLATLSIILLILFTVQLAAVLNPEYAAIKSLLGAVK